MPCRDRVRFVDDHARPRASVVLSLLGAIAATALWLAMIVTMVVVMVRQLAAYAMGYGIQALLVVVGAPLLWWWWRELLQPEVWHAPPDELDAPARPNRALSGEDEPPTRW